MALTIERKSSSRTLDCAFPPTRGPRMPTSCASSSERGLGIQGCRAAGTRVSGSSSPWTASRRGGSFPSTGFGKRRRSLVSPFERGSVRPSFRRVLSGFVGTLVFSTNSDADGIPFGAFDVPTVFFISKSDDRNRVDYGMRLGPALRPRDGRTGVSVLARVRALSSRSDPFVGHVRVDGLRHRRTTGRPSHGDR